MADGFDVVKFSFESSAPPGEPTLSNPNPQQSTPPPKADDGRLPPGEATKNLKTEADRLADALNRAEQNLQDDIFEGKSWVDISQAIDGLINKASKESGRSTDDISAAMDNLAKGVEGRGIPDNLSTVFDNLAKTENSLESAIRQLTAQLKKGVPTREPKEKPVVRAMTAPVQSSFLNWLSKYVTKPAIQAAQTPTLFRNNLIVTGLGTLNALSRASSSTASPGSRITPTAAANVSALGVSAARAASALVSVPAAALALGTAVVATTQVMDAAVSKIANSIVDFSPEVSIAMAQRQLQDFQNRRERAITIGPEIGALLMEFQDIDNQLAQLVTNLFNILNQPAVKWALDNVEDALSGVNSVLEYFSGMDDSLKGIRREYERERHEKLAEKGAKKGLDEFAFRLAAQALGATNSFDDTSDIEEKLNERSRAQGNAPFPFDEYNNPSF